MQTILSQLREDLKANIDSKTQKTFQRFFKEEVKYYGVNIPTVYKIAKKYWKRVRSLGKQKIFTLCEELLRSNYTEETFVVSSWLPEYIENLTPEDLPIFQRVD